MNAIVKINFLVTGSLQKVYHAVNNIPKVFAGLLCCSSILLSSCLKNQDNTGNGPKSQVAITSYVVNGSIGVALDNTSLTATPLVFGGGISTITGGYSALASGLHNLQLSAASNIVTDKTISFATGINYSLFVYDTVQNSKVKTLLLTDDLTAIDTVARARFLQFIPGADSLTLSLKKDTLTYTFADAYVGNKTAFATLAFSQAMKPGDYQLTLARKGTTVFQQASLTLTAGKLYSFIAKGVINGTGDYVQSVKLVQHN